MIQGGVQSNAQWPAQPSPVMSQVPVSYQGGSDMQSMIIQAALMNSQTPAAAARTLQLLQQANQMGHAAPPTYAAPPGSLQQQAHRSQMAPAGSKPDAECKEALEFCKTARASNK